MNPSGDANGQNAAGTTGKVFLRVGDPALRLEWVHLLQSLDLTVIEDGCLEPGNAREVPLQTDLIVLVLPGDEGLLTELLRATSQEEYPPPVLVFGSSTQDQLAKRALQAGAFTFLSVSATPVEKGSVLAAAVRYRAAQRQIQLLLRESELICSGLLGSFGHSSEKLQQAVQEAQMVQQTLKGVQAKITKAFL